YAREAGCGAGRKRCALTRRDHPQCSTGADNSIASRARHAVPPSVAIDHAARAAKTHVTTVLTGADALAPRIEQMTRATAPPATAADRLRVDAPAAILHPLGDIAAQITYPLR